MAFFEGMGPGISGLFTAILFVALLWVFGRMGDNINKIRKMMEEEIRKRCENGGDIR